MYRKAPSSDKWKKVKCKAKMEIVSAFDKSTAWGIDKKGNAYQWNGVTFSKVKTNKKMRRIAVNGENVSSQQQLIAKSILGLTNSSTGLWSNYKEKSGEMGS